MDICLQDPTVDIHVTPIRDSERRRITQTRSITSPTNSHSAEPPQSPLPAAPLNTDLHVAAITILSGAVSLITTIKTENYGPPEMLSR